MRFPVSELPVLFIQRCNALWELLGAISLPLSTCNQGKGEIVFVFFNNHAETMPGRAQKASKVWEYFIRKPYKAASAIHGAIHCWMVWVYGNFNWIADVSTCFFWAMRSPESEPVLIWRLDIINQKFLFCIRSVKVFRFPLVLFGLFWRDCHQHLKGKVRRHLCARGWLGNLGKVVFSRLLKFDHVPSLGLGLECVIL